MTLLAEQNTGREPDLVPVRHGRMLASLFTFYRGAARVMAADLKDTPRSGLNVQLCGDAHLLNFGVYGSPERRLVFDLNDFGETLPGPFEYDVKRLAASFVVAARDNGFIYLGAAGDSRHFYWRQLRDMKGSAAVEDMTPLSLSMYAGGCGWTLARAHARYADQNERDYAEFAAAVRSGGSVTCVEWQTASSSPSGTTGGRRRCTRPARGTPVSSTAARRARCWPGPCSAASPATR